MTKLINRETEQRRIASLLQLSPCDFADALGVEQFLQPSISSLWQPVKRIAGRAYTVECPAGDHLMFHAAVYRAASDEIIVAKGDPNFALAGGNVFAIAQSRGIAGALVDGRVRDLAEIRAMQFPVFARGVIPKPGAKKKLGQLNGSILCGGVLINNGDYILADEEGVVVIPQNDIDKATQIAQSRAYKDANTSIQEWQKNHQRIVTEALNKLGFIEK
jgi:regulator of RNase E activity RraA